MTEDEKEIRKMLKNLNRFFGEKELQLNAEKSKMMVFCRKDRKKEEKTWTWKQERIEEVAEFKYLGFTFKKNNKDNTHIKEVLNRAAAAMAQV